jgi:hypothetical protein
MRRHAQRHQAFTPATVELIDAINMTIKIRFMGGSSLIVRELVAAILVSKAGLVNRFVELRNSRATYLNRLE